jgi:flagellar export protein FliJ
MQNLRRKIKRVSPVIRIREATVEQELAILISIRGEKIRLVKEMQESQRLYVEGVQKLNHERASTSRMMVFSLESSIDFIKTKWQKLFRDVQELEQREKLQLAQVAEAQRQLKSVEKLKDKYSHEFKVAIDKNDQKQLDELSTRKVLEERQSSKPE